MKIVNLPQRCDEWRAWRREGITASDAAVLLDRSPHKTRWRLWAEKTGYAREADFGKNPLVRRGIENEDKARRAFEEKHGDMLLPVCVESRRHPLMRASLDGLGEDGAPVELKCPGASVWEGLRAGKENSAAYRLHYPQLQHQLLVTEAERGWLVYYFEGRTLEFPISRDEAMIEEILGEAESFWQRVTRKKAPEKDPLRDLYVPRGEEAARWIDATERYRLHEEGIVELKRRLSEIEEKRQACLETMKSLMAEYCHADCHGVAVTKYQAAGRVNYKKLLSEKLPEMSPEDIDRYREKASARCRVTIKARDVADEGLAPSERPPLRA